ncbi:MAG: precorrin-6Y C5,15-methyltransferase subunit CbiT [Gloeomargarita sp. SKYBB_i_bin120]|nr:precorrin-6Y C5,15-methyltransferase subunit CbiT [Gloeomargarita sp. SKYG98]MCS7292665.1 precorrin-6Y C5,15-methyltransferase subunit CbiT [Gloeomargarita sp. SKYB120]MDW8178227.1 precorrin-6Y C5,15-methyltransferase subunit CbiT [Gloeomargarita sp. SKYBB_i_bin120]
MRWPYVTTGIPDEAFERLPGIPLSKRESRVLILSQLCLQKNSIVWDIGAGTGTIAIESALLCQEGQVIAIERDEDVVGLIQRNAERFEVQNMTIVAGHAPDCLQAITPLPDRICLEGGRPVDLMLRESWRYLRQGGRLVTATDSLEAFYSLMQTLGELQARKVEVIQSAVNRLETRGMQRVLVALDPIFILSGEKP